MQGGKLSNKDVEREGKGKEGEGKQIGEGKIEK